MTGAKIDTSVRRDAFATERSRIKNTNQARNLHTHKKGPSTGPFLLALSHRDVYVFSCDARDVFHDRGDRHHHVPPGVWF